MLKFIDFKKLNDNYFQTDLQISLKSNTKCQILHFIIG